MCESLSAVPRLTKSSVKMGIKAQNIFFSIWEETARSGLLKGDIHVTELDCGWDACYRELSAHTQDITPLSDFVS